VPVQRRQYRLAGRPANRILVVARLQYPFRQALGSIQPPAQWVPALSPGGRATEAWYNHAPYIASRLKKEESYRPTSAFRMGPHGEFRCVGWLVGAVVKWL